MAAGRRSVIDRASMPVAPVTRWARLRKECPSLTDDGFVGAGNALMFCCASCGVPGVQMTVLNADVFVKLEMYNKYNKKRQSGGRCMLTEILVGASFWCT